MRISIKNRNTEKLTIKVQLSKEKVAEFRKSLKLKRYEMTRYQGCVLRAQGGGWYQISSDSYADLGWITERQAMFAMLRKIRSMFVSVKMEAPVINKHHYIIEIPAKAKRVAPPVMLERLANRINQKYGHALH